MCAALIGTLTAGSASADWLGSGYSDFLDRSSNAGVQNSSSGDGTVSFAAYQSDTPLWTEAFGAAFEANVVFLADSGTGATDEFVYFYQVVNTDLLSPEAVLRFFLVNLGPQGAATVSSYGFVTNFVFSDGEGNVGPGGNDELGAPVLDDPNTPVDERDRIAGNNLATSLSGPGAVSFAADAGAHEPVSGLIETGGLAFPTEDPVGFNDAVRFDLNLLPAGGYSSIFFITAHGTPTLRTAQVVDTQTTFNEVLSPTPVPAGLSLLLSGVASLGGIGAYLRRVRRNAA